MPREPKKKEPVELKPVVCKYTVLLFTTRVGLAAQERYLREVRTIEGYN